MAVDDPDLIKLTVEIVSAHISNNAVAISDVPGLLRDVHSALDRLGVIDPPAPEKPRPAVSPRASVKPDHIVCLACGAKHKMMKRHLEKAHGLTPDGYRAHYELPPSYPLVAPDYSRYRVELAQKFGLGQQRWPRKAVASDQ